MRRILGSLCLAMLLVGCAVGAGPVSGSPPVARRPSTGQSVEPQTAERIRRLMVPLLRAMNRPIPLNQVRVGIIDDQRINAGSAGSGQFFVTTGLLRQANDEQLAAVLAHEVAHEDLGHVAKQQALGAGLNIAMVILESLAPGSGRFTPIAGELAMRAYGRNEEYEADRHGVELLRRVGLPKETMINTLRWLMARSGSSSGGFFSTHPGTDDRIERLQRLG